MKCQKCGSEYEGSVCPNGCNNSGTAKKKPIYKRWWFWLIIAIVVVSVASSGGEETSVPDETGVKSENVSANTDASETTAAMEATTEATVVDPYYHVGDAIEANGLKINIVSIEKWESSNQYIQPEDGYQYFRVFISAENTSSADRYLSSFEFTCYADGKKEDEYVMGDEILDGGELSSGRKTEGYLYFSVPVDAQQIEIEYETSFWTDRKAIIKVELA